ncbi:acyltransferase [Leuconostocaceae bacterium ESL0958]|nr:acyltransferase [Leuconostocaceae bacterium ESL0958]
MTKRIEWIDVAKAIGIVLVVYGHVILGLHDSGIWAPSQNYDWQHSIIYSTHMPLFFFLSGIFAIRWVERPAGKALGQKLRTLIIPYFIWGVIQAVVMQVFAKSTNNGQGLGNALQLPFMPYAQFWFLYDLFWIFLLYYFTGHVLHWSFRPLLILALLLFLLSPYLGFWEFWRISYYFLFFVLGTKVLSLGQQLDRVRPGITLIAYVLLQVAYFELDLSKFWQNLLSFAVAMAGILVIIHVSKYLNHWTIDYIGQKSMVIYVLHIMFTAGSRIFLSKAGLDNLYLQGIVGLLLGVLAPLLVYEITRKMKIEKLLF